MKLEEIFRLILKLAQFIVTFLLLYAIGFPYWMIVAAGLLVPIYGIYLMFRSPGKTKGGTPYADYKLNAIAKSWHKVDISLCLTMAIVCFIFALLLFFFYFKFTTFTSKILLAACSSLLLSILYAMNGILLTRKLQSGTIDFPASHKLFSTSASKTSPLTNKPNERTLDLFGSSRKRDESVSKYSNSKNKLNNDDEIGIKRKSAVPSPEPPKDLHGDDDDQRYSYQQPKQSLSPQYSIERRPRATSWFTDTGDNNKKDFPTMTIESSFISSPIDNSKGAHLDAREQYIKSKQYRDFMETTPNNTNKQKNVVAANVPKRSTSKIQQEKLMEDFNEKFASAISASTENLEKQQKLEEEKQIQNQNRISPKLLVSSGNSIISSSNEKNYKPSTTAYSRKQIIPTIESSRKEGFEESYRASQHPESQPSSHQPSILKKISATGNNPFETSQSSSQASHWSSQSELDKVFYSKKQHQRNPSYGERAIDVGSYKASPIEVIDAERKNSDTHSSGTLHSLDVPLDVEATPKAPRQQQQTFSSYAHPEKDLPPPLENSSNNVFKISSASTIQSHQSISVNDSPGMPMKFRHPKDNQIRDTQISEYHQIPGRIAIKQAVIPQKGVITGIARPYSFQGENNSKQQQFQNQNQRYEENDLSSTPSRSISSLTGSSSQARDASLIADSTASSTIRMDDIDRRDSARSPLRDSSLMTTSTIVNMNSASIRDWSPSPISSISNNIDSRKESSSEAATRIHNQIFFGCRESPGESSNSGGSNSGSNNGKSVTPQKKGFDVIIRPRDSPIDSRPQSTMTTEFSPQYNASSTTLTIKSSPDYSKNRHLSTQF